LDEEKDTFISNDYRLSSQYLHSRRLSRGELGFIPNFEQRKCVSSMLLHANNNRHGPTMSDIYYNKSAGLSHSLNDIHNHHHQHQHHLNETNKRIIINIGGVRFETYKNTLKLVEESRLANLSETNSDFDPINNEYFFDRDPDSFQAILNYFRTGKLHAPGEICGNLFYEELEFWGINEQSIQPCCWTKYSTMRNCDEILKHVMDHIDEPEGIILSFNLFLRKTFDFIFFINEKTCIE
jgi:hypothetical protein